MIKIRIRGTEEDVLDFIYEMKQNEDIKILQISQPYRDSDSVYVRVYIEVKMI